MILSVSERQSYYADSGIRQRIADFFGGGLPARSTAVYVAPGTEWQSLHRQRRPLEECSSWMNHGAELNRSLWDRESLVAHLDIEYVNFDRPAHPFLAAEQIFELQRPVVTVLESELRAYHLAPLHLLTGRGHHFVWRISADSRVFAKLSALGRMSASLKRLYASTMGPAGETVAPEMGAAFAGVGLVVEFLAHQVKARAAMKCRLPIELGAIEVGGAEREREVIALDITEYGDPLCSRVVRAPFSVYLKPWQQREELGDETVGRLPPMFVIPLNGLDVNEGIRIRRDVEEVERLAARVSTEIPDAPRAMHSIIKAYRKSPLARFHQWFYSQEHDADALWPETYDLTPLDALPSCARHILEHPNDLLLRPACVRMVVRSMLALGWHPRHIAGLLRSKYERDYGWGDQWNGYDPATRADFYARIFTGEFVMSLDNLIDFNGDSARGEGLCFFEGATQDLDRFRDSLLNRRKYERLACRPFNGLFLPDEHL
jgi:hypothetical protein